ncbi:hypothetical protein [Yunchengibacter salinarum]|uniref:hypothetical protein n=1 Tax=Yunchengibacter salinarum TaxID=3133399 RepID=UPI0035B5A584
MSTEGPQRTGSRRRLRPKTRPMRFVLGVALICGGVLGFLPILGFWMIPLGILVLSDDIPPLRRWRRRMDVRYGRWRARRRGETRRERTGNHDR